MAPNGEVQQIEPLKQILVLVCSSVATVIVSHGGARHLYYLNYQKITLLLKWSWMVQPIAIMTMATAKISVAFLLLRIIGPTTVWRKRFLYFSIISLFAIGVLCSIVSFVQCNPPRALWESVPGAKCWDPKTQIDIAVFGSSPFPSSHCFQPHPLTIYLGYNAIMDICLALLPSTIIWKADLHIRKKIGLCILLGLGIL